MNIWLEILQPGLLALLYTALFTVPAWALFRWLVRKEWMGLLERSIWLFIILITAIIFFGSGGKEVLAGLQVLIGPVGDPPEPVVILTRLADTAVILVAAFLFARLIDTLIFEIYLANRDEAVPKLLRDALRLVIIVLALVFILIDIFAIDAMAVGGSAAVITVVLGLALQNILGDLFSGVVLQFERPLKQGDWVKIGDHEGEVVELNWRAIRLKTRQHVGVVIPNSVIAKAEISNYNLATPSAAIDLYIGTEYKEPPNRVKGAIMEAILMCGDALRQPPPRVQTHEYGSSAIIYRLRFWVKDYEKIQRIGDEVLTNIWYVFKRYSITIPWPIRNVYMRQEEELTVEETAGSVTDLLRQVDIFAPLTRQQLESLSEGLVPKFFGRGEILVRQGDEGASFFVIEQGRVEVLLASDEGSLESSVAVLGPRDFFGEMSLLAGDRRTATVRAIEDVRVVIIDKEAFARIILEHPEVAAEMAAIYYQRTQELTETRERATEESDTPEETESGDRVLLRRIQRFFGL
ncbi:cyclic nucleotide-binding domain-containing protein [Gemmatimonadota bacterium]